MSINEDYVDLAPSQIAEWYANQLDPKSPLYNISLNHFFIKNIDEDIFFKTWQHIINSHDCFRIRFTYKDDMPKQFLGDAIHLNKETFFIDCRDTEEKNIFKTQNDFAKKYALEPFDFRLGPLFRVHLIQYPNKEYQLIFTIHHIIWDETSTLNLLHDFAVTYGLLMEGTDLGLPDLNHDFLTFSRHETHNINEGNYQKHHDYWLDQFKKIPPPLELPTDFTRPPVQSYNGQTISQFISSQCVTKLKNQAHENRHSLFSFFMTALSLYFYRTTEQSEFSIGCPVSGRKTIHEKMMGCFATPVALYIRIDESMTFHDLQKDIHNQIINGLEHYHYPCHKIIEQQSHKKDLSRPKLFSVMAGVQNEKPAIDKIQLDNNAFYSKNIYASETHGARFDLAIGLDLIGDDIKLFCTFNSDLYQTSTIQEALICMENIILQGIEDNQLYLKDYELLNSRQYKHILEYSASAKVALPKAHFTHHFFQLAQSAPDETAVISKNQAYSYFDLAKTITCFTTNLLETYPEKSIIGVILRPGYELIVTLLSILSAGFCYVPIDPEYPIERIEDIINQTQPITIIAEACGSMNSLLKNQNTSYYQDYLREPHELHNHAIKHISPASMAYIIFTSGSTGKPKGIPITHESLSNLLTVTQSQYKISQADRVLSSTSFTFDASILELFWPLMYGGTVVIPSEYFAKTPEKMLNNLQQHKITLFQTTPSLFSSLLDESLSRPDIFLPNLRLIICGSEALTRQVQEITSQAFQCRLVNHYGPTESTVDAITFDCSHPYIGNTVPLGRPIPNTQIFIMDKHDEFLPIGAKGQIVIASPGLTPGYWNDEMKSKASFFNKAIAGKKVRLYRTGDYGKMDSDGNIYFYGRLDQQIKINGNRVELEEIESQLLKHKSTSRVALKFQDEKLEAYIQLHQSSLNTFKAKDTIYTQFTLAQMPSLESKMNSAHYATWPRYFDGSLSLKKYWPKLYPLFPEYQFCLIEPSGEVACVANGIPFYWSGNPGEAPSTWDQGIALAFEQHEQNIKPNAIMGLSGIVLEKYRNKGLSRCIVQGFRALAKMHNLDHFLGPVRPVGILNHPEYTLDQWAAAKNDSNEPMDSWLRTHTRLGADLLHVSKNAQKIHGSLKDWENWLGTALPREISFKHPTTLQEIKIDHSSQTACYYDPAIWVAHSNLNSTPHHIEHVSVVDLKKYLAGILPSYMCPSYLEIKIKIPLTLGGKIDKALLSRDQNTQNAVHLKPQNTIQKVLLKACQAVLKSTDFYIDQDFFEFGGQSLQAIAFLAKIETKLGCCLPLKAFYQNPNIIQLSALISTKIKESCDV